MKYPKYAPCLSCGLLYGIEKFEDSFLRRNSSSRPEYDLMAVASMYMSEIHNRGDQNFVSYCTYREVKTSNLQENSGQRRSQMRHIRYSINITVITTTTKMNEASVDTGSQNVGDEDAHIS